MKKCLRCEQVYGDETNFCLSDGSALVPASGSLTTDGETPTVYSGAPPPTANFGAASQFIPPNPTAAPPAKKSSALLIALAVGLFALLAVGAAVGVIIYGLNSGGKGNENSAVVSSSPGNANQWAIPEKKTDDENTAQNLKRQQEKLDQEKQKLAEERRKLEEKKKEATPTATPASARTAVIVDPPSNIRAAPNGAVLCVARTRGTIVNILGSTDVADNNGTWYYTDYCGTRGVIHSTQFRF